MKVFFLGGFDIFNISTDKEVGKFGVGAGVESSVFNGSAGLAFEEYQKNLTNNQFVGNYDAQVVLLNNQEDPKTKAPGAPLFLSLDLSGEYSFATGFRNRTLGGTIGYDSLKPGQDLTQIRASIGATTDYTNNNANHFSFKLKGEITPLSGDEKQSTSKKLK